jgi:nitroreductase
MDVIEAIRSRRSIRDYEDRKVERSVLENILWDAAQAPRPPISNKEPFVFIVIEGADRVSNYGALALQYAREHRAAGPGYDWVDRPGFSVFFNAPVVVVICALVGSHGQAASDCNRAGQNLMLSAYARGLGTCWVGSPEQWIRDPATKQELGIPESHESFAIFTLGYAVASPNPHPLNQPTVIWR